MMRIEPPKGPGDAPAGAHHGAVDIDRQPRELQPRDGLGGRRDPGQLTEARDQRIPSEIAKMLQPARAGVEQRQHEQGQPAPAIVAARRCTRGAQPTRQIALPQVPAEQFQAAVRGQRLVHELDVQLPLDHPVQARYAQSHQRGLLCEGSNVGAFSLSIAQEAFLLPIHDATQHLFSDWG